MGSEISHIGAGSAGMSVMRPAATLPLHPSSAQQMPETLKGQAPKPQAIHFDAAELRQSLQDAVKMLNQLVKANNRGLGFHIDEAVGGPIVTVRSTETGEVVRQIPSDTVVNLAHSIDRMKGLLFTAKS